MNRCSAEAFLPPKNAAIISINTPTDGQALLSINWDSILRWSRDDNDEPVSEEDVDRIWNFVTTNEDKDFFVHCDAGISRSCAVALFIGALLDREVIGIDCNSTQFANAVIKAALMHRLWAAHIKENYIEELVFKRQK